MKKFIMFMLVAFMCSTANAKTDNNTSDVYYDQVIKLGKKSLNKKSVKMIIREILNRKRIEKYKMPNTIPIPFYHPLYDMKPYKAKDIA